MATFTFNNDTTISGTSNADLMLGTDTAGNTNDVVYGLQGDDTINATFSLSTSTLYGGQGNDVVYANNSNNVLYGNQGDDTLIIGESTNDRIYANDDTLYGGQGNDSIEMEGPGNGNVAYGGAGDNRFYLNEQFGSTVVGGLGNDHIFGSNSSVLLLYGSDPSSSIYGNDSIKLENVAASTVHGGAGDDSVYGVNDTANTYYGGGGNDSLGVLSSSGDVLYGNQGNDSVFGTGANALTEYGGQGNDDVEQFFAAHGVLYGNKGNDLVLDALGLGIFISGGGAAEGNSVLYGGQGDDALVALGAGGDSMSGGQGDNLFAGNDFLPSEALTFTANDFITIEDFVSGNDTLSMSQHLGANAVGLTKANDLAANNANDALSFADAFYANDSAPHYLFVYGGSGAGYLFYNGDNGGTVPQDGMILTGDNAESSVQANDIQNSFFAGIP